MSTGKGADLAAEVAKRASFEVFPRVAAEVHRAVVRTAATVRDLEHVVRQDPYLAQMVQVRGAQTPMSGRGAGLKEAILSMGPQAVRDLALTLGFARSAGQAEGRARRYWQHALRTGCIADAVAVEHRVRRADAFTAGALLDFGVLAMLLCGPPDYVALIDEVGVSMFGLEMREWDHYGFDHAQVADLIARYMDFPPYVSQVILEHHTQSTSVLGDVAAAASAMDISMRMGLPPIDAADDALSRLRPHRLHLTVEELARCGTLGAEAAASFQAQVGGFSV
jgi:HD-like signal output (HDOD) protein